MLHHISLYLIHIYINSESYNPILPLPAFFFQVVTTSLFPMSVDLPFVLLYSFFLFFQSPHVSVNRDFILQVYSCCCKWQTFILFMADIPLCVCVCVCVFVCVCVCVWLPWWFKWQRNCLQCRRPKFDPEEHPLEKGMAAHSSILAWRIPCTEEPSRLQCSVTKNRTQLSD